MGREDYKPVERERERERSDTRDHTTLNLLLEQRKPGMADINGENAKESTWSSGGAPPTWDQ